MRIRGTQFDQWYFHASCARPLQGHHYSTGHFAVRAD